MNKNVKNFKKSQLQIRSSSNLVSRDAHFSQNLTVFPLEAKIFLKNLDILFSLGTGTFFMRELKRTGIHIQIRILRPPNKTNESGPLEPKFTVLNRTDSDLKITFFKKTYKTRKNFVYASRITTVFS
jgi:hypothetical protein